MLADPPLLLDQDAMHDRDLTGGAAERERGDPQPDPERLAKGDPVRQRRSLVGSPDGCRDGRAHRAPSRTRPDFGFEAGQLWVSSVASRHQRKKAS